MRDLPPLFVTLNWPAGVATVVVHGQLDPLTYCLLRERLAWVSENCPRRLVLDLRGVADRFGGQIAALITVARQQLPPGCLLDVRSAIPAVVNVSEIAGMTEGGSAQASEQVAPAGPVTAKPARGR
jgi:anti-anti-sigma regulatory factor